MGRNAVDRDVVLGRVLGRRQQALAGHLQVVLGRLHAQDVRDDAVDLHAADEAREEQLLHGVGAEGLEGREAQHQVRDAARVELVVLVEVLDELPARLLLQLLSLLLVHKVRVVYNKINK